MPGKCRICGARGPFGFQPPGPRSQRPESWIAWACEAHRAAVDAQWSAHVHKRPDTTQGAADGGEHVAKSEAGVSTDAHEPEQGTLI